MTNELHQYNCFCGASWFSEIPKDDMENNLSMDTHLQECPAFVGALESLREKL